MTALLEAATSLNKNICNRELLDVYLPLIENLLEDLEKQSILIGEEALPYETKLAASLVDICAINEFMFDDIIKIECFCKSIEYLVFHWGEINRLDFQNILSSFLKAGLNCSPVKDKTEVDISLIKNKS